MSKQLQFVYSKKFESRNRFECTKIVYFHTVFRCLIFLSIFRWKNNQSKTYSNREFPWTGEIHNFHVSFSRLNHLRASAYFTRCVIQAANGSWLRWRYYRCSFAVLDKCKCPFISRRSNACSHSSSACHFSNI